MKKLLLVLVPAVLLLTSCLDGDDPTPAPEEVLFYDTFILIYNHGKEMVNMVDKFIADYEKNGELAQGITVSDIINGAATLTANLDVFDNDGYTNFKGTLAVALSGITTKLSDATSKVINVSSLQFYSAGLYDYGGTITVNGSGSTPGEVNQTISYSSFSLSPSGNSEKLWSINYAYQYSYNEASDTHTWSEGYASGVHSYYGIFDVSITTSIVKKGTLAFVSSGGYLFSVQNIGNGAFFRSEYGRTSGGITIIGIDNTVHEYQQSTLY